jgi:hypothetical protein
MSPSTAESEAENLSHPSIKTAGIMMREAVACVDSPCAPVEPMSVDEQSDLLAMWNEESDVVHAHCAASGLMWVGFASTRLSAALWRPHIASYGFCTVLMMVWMRRFIPRSCTPAERQSRRSGHRR